MKNLKKKLFATVTALFCSASAMCLMGTTGWIGSADEVEGVSEVESNDTIATANALNMDTPCTGNISSSSDKDYYKVTLDANQAYNGSGAFSITFERGIESSSYATYNKWTVQILDENGTVYNTAYMTGDNTSDTTTLRGFSAGTYYVKISPYNTYASYTYSTADYILTVNSDDDSTTAYEGECKGTSSNDTAETADSLEFGTPITGYTYDEDDVDYYAVTLEEDGAFSFSFQNHGSSGSTRNRWIVSVLDEDENVIYYKNITSETATTNTYNMYGFSAGTYYIMVETAYSSSYGDWSSLNYTLTANLDTSDQMYEAELSNDTKSDADTLTLDTSIMGNLYSSDDVDVYKFTLKEDGIISISFNTPGYTSGWKFTLKNSSFLGTTTWKTDSANTSIKNLSYAAGTYYLVVECNGNGTNSVGNNYTLKVSYQSAADSDQLYEAEGENDSYADTSNVLPVNTSIVGSLYASGDVDVYKVNLSADCIISIAMNKQSSSNSDSWTYSLLDSNGQTVRSWDSDEVTETQLMGFSKGTYYIQVANSSYYGNNYKLELSYTAASASTQLYEKECYNNTSSDADTLPLNKSIIGHFYSSSDVDYYKIVLTESMNLTVDVTGETFYAYVLDANGSELVSCDNDDNDSYTRSMELEGLNSGTYYIMLKPTTTYRSSGKASTENYTIKTNAIKLTSSSSSSDSSSNSSNSSSSGSSGSSGNILLGDVDSDGEITILDASLVLEEYARCAAGLDASFDANQILAADVDGDDEITIMDASKILNYYASAAAGNTPSWS